MVVHDFARSFARGQYGEEHLALRILEEHFPQHAIRRTNSLAEQQAGFDFVLRPEKGRSLLAEVKTDFYTTPNTAVELYHQYVDGRFKPGWFYSSKADWLLYLRPALGYYLLLDLPLLRHWLQDLSLYREVTVKNPNFETRVRLVPVADLERLGAPLYRLDK